MIICYIIYPILYWQLCNTSKHNYIIFIMVNIALTKAQQDNASNLFRSIRDQICKRFEEIEKEFDSTTKVKFECIPWNRGDGGGGEISIMHGKVFEKIGVNISTVYGKFSDEFKTEIPHTSDNEGHFWASGVSLVSHMHSPLVPAIHMNTRCISTTKYWFGGGTDLTPMYYNDYDYHTFHNNLMECCDKYDKSYYKKFRDWADKYFFLKHRNEHRGIGGIFYDYINEGNWEKELNFSEDVANTFLSTYSSIVRNNMFKTFTKEQREYQLYKRGRYTEFNLIFDRGTKFGLMTNGNTDAIMISMPPVAKWGFNCMSSIIN